MHFQSESSESSGSSGRLTYGIRPTKAISFLLLRVPSSLGRRDPALPSSKTESTASYLTTALATDKIPRNPLQPPQSVAKLPLTRGARPGVCVGVVGARNEVEVDIAREDITGAGARGGTAEEAPRSGPDVRDAEAEVAGAAPAAVAKREAMNWLAMETGRPAATRAAGGDTGGNMGGECTWYRAHMRFQITTASSQVFAFFQAWLENR
ncbi:hypothetical protein FB451DRAFT_1180724 [Mycena latifolia]|nr:hypothetical protein FB451DRAFT_1180724 [Mycena latifolia]